MLLRLLLATTLLAGTAPLHAQLPGHPPPERVLPLLGWVADPAHHAAALEPHLPESWKSITVSNLMVGKERVEVTITQDVDVYSVSLHRLSVGPPLSIRVAPGLPLAAHVDRITVNEFDVPVQVEITMHDIHPVTELLLFNDAIIEFHFTLR